MRYSKQNISLAFTLVELIVVVTILAILATIGFVSYSSYLTGVRDTNRLSQLVSIHDGLSLYSTTNSLPIPDDSIEVQANGELIGYQGEAGSNTLETIDFTKGGKDPKDDSYFSYYLSSDRKKLQLLAFLEEEESVTVQNTITLQTHAVDFANRIPTVYGKKLGILTATDNTPAHQIPALVSSGAVDIATATDYIAHFTDTNSYEGNGQALVGKVMLYSQYEGSFSPSDVKGLFMWFDANDPATIDKNGSNVISEWRDKSGNNNHFNVIEGDPTYGDYKINGARTVYFDGTDSMHTTTNFNAPYTIIYVAQMEGTQSFKALGGDYHLFIGFYNGNKNDLYLDGGWVLNSTDAPGTNTELYSVSRDGALATSFYNNGEMLVLSDETAGTSNFGNLRIGGSGPSGGGLVAHQKSKVYVAEVIIFDRVINDTERTKIEAYLNTKWGPF